MAAAVLLLFAAWMWFSGALAGLVRSEAAEYLGRRLFLAGTVPAVLGAIAAVFLVPDRQWSYEVALVLVLVAVLPILVFGPLTWSPPPATANESDFAALYRQNPWMDGDVHNLDFVGLWVTIAGQLLVASLGWYGLRRTGDRRASDEADTNGRSEVAWYSTGRTVGRGASERDTSGRSSAAYRPSWWDPHRAAVWLLAGSFIGALAFGSWSAYEVVAHEARIDDPGLAWGGLAWLAISFVPTGIGVWRLEDDRRGALVFLGVGAVAAVAGALVYWSSLGGALNTLP